MTIILGTVINEERKLRLDANNLRNWAQTLDLRIERGEKALENIATLQKKNMGPRAIKSYIPQVEAAVNSSESLLKAMKREAEDINRLAGDLWGRLEKLKSALEKPARREPIIRGTISGGTKVEWA